MPRTVSQVRPTFDRSAPRSSIIEPALSAVAFSLLIASWACAYVVIVPADPVQHRGVHIAQVQR